MRLPFFRSKDAAAKPAQPQRARSAAQTLPDEAEIAAARTQARRRLIGAVVLLAVGVIGFPLLFETQPRPLPQDTPIVVSTDLAAARPAVPAPAVPRPLPVLPADAGVEPVAQGAALTPPGPAPAPASTPGPASAARTAPAAAVAPAPRPPSPTGTIAQAATAAATPAAGRWVVQVGAYNEAERLKAARARLQRRGDASFTQEVDSPTGRRTRVRVGPYKTRAEADAVAAKVKAAGLQAAVLSL
jgi:DedD protein